MRAKVCDFGLSKATMLQSASARASKSNVVGTPAWESPEELNARKGDVLDDEKCDVYSFSVTVWEILTRRVPWENERPLDILKTVVFQNDRLPYDREDTERGEKGIRIGKRRAGRSQQRKSPLATQSPFYR